jgi:hypothetical protein
MDRPAICEHLGPVLDDALAQGAKITFAGQPWSSNCRLWVYLDVQLDVVALQTRFKLPPEVTVHTHRGTHDGMEHGLVCTQHQDAIMGFHPEQGGRVLS